MSASGKSPSPLTLPSTFPQHQVSSAPIARTLSSPTSPSAIFSSHHADEADHVALLVPHPNEHDATIAINEAFSQVVQTTSSQTHQQESTPITHVSPPPQHFFLPAVGSGGKNGGPAVQTYIPARLDRLPFSRFHWLVVLALGTSWVLDGLEMTVLGVIGAVLMKESTLGQSPSQVGQLGAIYVFGCVVGSLFFGYIGDRFGRRKLFLITPSVYLTFTVLTSFATGQAWFAVCRFFCGLGVGGEYAAINSTIDEFIPARVRGTVELCVMGSYWLGALIGSLCSIALLDDRVFADDVGWRLFFGIGGSIGFGILCLRRLIPESPRWLLTHGRASEAEQIVREIEDRTFAHKPEPIGSLGQPITIQQADGAVPLAEIFRTIFGCYTSRAVLGIGLMIAQSFFYNAIFFTYAVVLRTFYDVAANNVGYYLIFFCLGNYLGPITLGRMFDAVGRVRMISTTYMVSGMLLAVTAVLFLAEALEAITQTLLWSLTFFVASSSASSAYLTVSEVFPMETRAMAIAICYSIGTGLGGVAGPLLFGSFVESDSRVPLFFGYLFAAGLMVAAAVMECMIGVHSENKSLEEVAPPITASAQSAAQLSAAFRSKQPCSSQANLSSTHYGTSPIAMDSPSSVLANQRIDPIKAREELEEQRRRQREAENGGEKQQHEDDGEQDEESDEGDEEDHLFCIEERSGSKVLVKQKISTLGKQRVSASGGKRSSR